METRSATPQGMPAHTDGAGPAPDLGQHLAARAARLEEEHLGLQQEFDDLIARARTGDARCCDEVWSRFAQRLEDHMAFEERSVLPLYERSGPEALGHQSTPLNHRRSQRT